MAEQQQIEVGQVWRSRDKRDNGKLVSVIWIQSGDGQTIRVDTGVRQTSMTQKNLRTRYRLVRGVTLDGPH